MNKFLYSLVLALGVIVLTSMSTVDNAVEKTYPSGISTFQQSGILKDFTDPNENCQRNGFACGPSYQAGDQVCRDCMIACPLGTGWCVCTKCQGYSLASK